jgi:hypothetical protein
MNVTVATPLALFSTVRFPLLSGLSLQKGESRVGAVGVRDADGAFRAMAFAVQPDTPQ